jgi:hypothetical protein
MAIQNRVMWSMTHGMVRQLSVLCADPKDFREPILYRTP